MKDEYNELVQRIAQAISASGSDCTDFVRSALDNMSMQEYEDTKKYYSE